MELQIEYRAVKNLLPYTRNARIHGSYQVETLADCIRLYGFNNPVLVDKDGIIIAGHGRVMAAELLGMKTVPVIVLGHLSDAEKRAYIIADNKIPMLAGWDADKLSQELSDLSFLDFDLTSLGFDFDELDMLLKNDNDFIPEAKPIQVGAHTRKPKEEELEDKKIYKKIIFKCTIEEYDIIVEHFDGELSAERLVQLIQGE